MHAKHETTPGHTQRLRATAYWMRTGTPNILYPMGDQPNDPGRTRGNADSALVADVRDSRESIVGCLVRRLRSKVIPEDPTSWAL